MIIFVGDKPSNKNTDPKVPFVGTKSYKTLLEWIVELQVSVTDVVLANKEHVKTYGYIPDCYISVNNHHIDIDTMDKVIALGEAASKYLNKCGVKHYKLPHPSGRNLKLNDKKYVKDVLKDCRKWINDN